MRVCFVSTRWFAWEGGIQTVNRELACSLVRLLGENNVLCVVPEADEKEITDAKNQKVRLIIGGPHYLDAVTRLREEIPDFIVGHSIFTGIAAQALAKLTPSQAIHFVHTDPEDIEGLKEYREHYVNERERRSAEELRLCRAAAAVVCIGPRLARTYSDRLKACSQHLPKILELNCGFEGLEKREQPSSLEVMSIGRTDSIKVKGLDLAVLASAYAFSKLGEAKKQFRLRIRGANRKPEELEKTLIKMVKHITKRERMPIQVLEYNLSRDALHNDLKRTRLLLMPSRAEGFGLSAMEAFSLGVPVLISKSSGVAELLGQWLDSSYGAADFVLPIGEDNDNTAKIWAEKIIDVLNRSAHYEAAVEALRQWLELHASWIVAAKSFLGLLQELKGSGANATLLRIGADGTGEAIKEVEIGYLTRLSQPNAERFALTQVAEDNYRRGREAANRGQWEDSYKYHLTALSAWRTLEVRARVARSEGRLAWVLISQGSVPQAREYLEQAVKHDALQGAANYFWAAQYCFRAGGEEDAKEMLHHFVSVCLTHKLVKLDSPKPNIFASDFPLRFVEQFYSAMVASEETDGWTDTSWSDKGRLALVRASLEGQNFELQLGEAKRCFEKCGLSSYVAFCDGKILLRTAAHELKLEARLNLLIAASEAFGRVVQRFKKQEEILNCFETAMRLEIVLLSGILEKGAQMDVRSLFTGGPGEALRGQFGATNSELGQIADVFLERCSKLNVDWLKGVPPEFVELFSNLYRRLPDLEGYYLPIIQNVLSSEFIKNSISPIL